MWRVYGMCVCMYRIYVVLCEHIYLCDYMCVYIHWTHNLELVSVKKKKSVPCILEGIQREGEGVLGGGITYTITDSKGNDFKFLFMWLLHDYFYSLFLFTSVALYAIGFFLSIKNKKKMKKKNQTWHFGTNSTKARQKKKRIMFFLTLDEIRNGFLYNILNYDSTTLLFLHYCPSKSYTSLLSVVGLLESKDL